MSILREVYDMKVSFYRANGREPDRLIMHHETYGKLMSDPDIRRQIGYNSEELMGMKIIRTSAEIPGGMEVR